MLFVLRLANDLPMGAVCFPSPAGKCTARDTADHLGKFLLGVNFKADMSGWVEMRAVKFDLSSMGNK